MAAASAQRLVSGLAGPSSFSRGRVTEAQQLPCSAQTIVLHGSVVGLGASEGLGSWKSTRRRAGVRCSAAGFKGFGDLQGIPKLPLGTFLGDLRESNKDVKWALDYWDQELEDGYKSLDEWKAQLSNLRQGNPTIKWAFDYWARELEDGYKSLDEWGAQLADIQSGTWLSKLRADNPDVKWALDYWDQELLDGYKSLDEWKAQAGDIGNVLSANPLYVAVGVAAVSIPILLFLSMNKGYAGNLSASEAFARLNKEDGAILVDIRSKEEKAKEGSPKLGRKVLSVAMESDAGLGSEDELRTAVKGRASDQGALIVLLDSAGSSASQAAKILSGEGYSRVFVVNGGAQGPQGWRESQLPWRTPQTFTLDLGEIKDAVTSTIQTDS
eukprot:TRINITY_DN3300_c0_g1_i1.p1 TRINITY_DN3300_c0_g1~~TRINITY_DN3300_c0_g1_i1.p1  ORF type:complete len:399 (+),score=55.05 TRINITY_DN3300_c0_g1_i1:50-1198(+)